MKNVALLSTLAAALLLVAPAPAQAQTDERSPLRWNAAEGDAQRYAFGWTFAQKTQAGGMDLNEIEVAVSFELEEKVEAVAADGTATVAATIRAIKTSGEAKMMGMPSPKESYDSKTDEGSKGLRVIRTLVGETFRFKRTATGEVTEVTGGDAIREELVEAAEKEMAKLLEGMGGGMGGRPGGGMGGMGGMGDMAAVFLGQMAIAFTDETLKSTLNVVNHVLPQERKHEGETWNLPIKQVLPQIGSLTATGRYKHDGAAAGVTRISFRPEGNIDFVAHKAAGDNNPQAEMQRQLLANQEVKRTKITGVAVFGPAKLMNSEVVQEIDTEGDVPQMLQMMMGGADGAKMKISHKLTIRYEALNDGAQGGAREGSRF